MLRQMFWLLFVMLVITPVAAQQQASPPWRALTSATDNNVDSTHTWLTQTAGPHALLFSRSLLPELPGSGTDTAQWHDAPVYQRHTGILVLLDDSDRTALQRALTESVGADTDINALVGYYPSLQQVLQQRELLFWQLPLWTMIINFCSAFVLLLLHNRHSDMPQSSWLIACALLGNMYFIQQLSSIDLPPLLINLSICVWLYFLSRLGHETRRQAPHRGLDWLLSAVLVMQVFAALADSTFVSALIVMLYSASLLVMNTRAPVFLQPGLDQGSKVLLSAVCLLMMTVIADQALQISNVELAAHPGMQLQLVPFAQIAGVLAALYFLVNQHADTQRELQNLNASLDARVKSATEELQARYQQLVKDALDAASMRERKNIYQSIHEDLSDKLLQLFYSAKDKNTADLARTALAELRDSRSITPDHKRLLVDVLADARTEIQQRCDQAGIDLKWLQDARLAECLVNARQSSAVNRTLREAFSNLFKHAKASQVMVELTINADSQLTYSVNDNGVGMVANTRPGRGLVNMQNRIRELGGSLTFSSPASGGTTLLFTLPLDEHETADSLGMLIS